MKGIVLAGGSGTRLRPMTRVTNKQLLHVYDRPLVYFPILALREAGITDILVISGPGHAGQLLDLLGSGKDLGLDLSFDIQEEPKGLAHGLLVAEKFARGDKVAMILGDNIFGDNLASAVKDFKKQKKGAKIALKHVPDPERFGVVRFDKNEKKILEVVEKPKKKPPSNWMVTGFYLYDERVFDFAKSLELSNRGEYEITDLNNIYIKEGTMSFQRLNGVWIDAGTIDSLLRANLFIAQQVKYKKIKPIGEILKGK